MLADVMADVEKCWRMLNNVGGRLKEAQNDFNAEE